jgi:hypothetical protein
VTCGNAGHGAFVRSPGWRLSLDQSALATVISIHGLLRQSNRVRDLRKRSRATCSASRAVAGADRPSAVFLPISVPWDLGIRQPRRGTRTYEARGGGDCANSPPRSQPHARSPTRQESTDSLAPRSLLCHHGPDSACLRLPVVASTSTWASPWVSGSNSAASRSFCLSVSRSARVCRVRRAE